MKRIISTLIAAMMMVNVFSISASAGWDASVIQSQTQFSFGANNIVTSAVVKGFQAGSLQVQQTISYNAAGQIASIRGADGALMEVRHYNSAGNLDSRDMVYTDPTSGATSIRTTYYLGGGVAITVDHGQGSTLTEGGATGGDNYYTSAQLQTAFNQLVAGTATSWASLGITIANISMSGAKISQLGPAAIARLYGISTETTSGTNGTTSFKVGDPTADGGTVQGFVLIDGVVYGLSSKGNLVRWDGNTNQTGAWGTWEYDAEGNMTVTVTHNTIGENEWNGTVTIKADGTIVVEETTQGSAEEMRDAGISYSVTHTATVNGQQVTVQGNSAVLIGGKLFQVDASGNLYSSDGAKVGTYTFGSGRTGGSWTNNFGAGVVATIMEEAAANPYSTFTVNFDNNMNPLTLSYYSQTQGALVINMQAFSANAVTQTDPLVTGSITGVTTQVINGITHFFVEVAADLIDMFDGEGSQQADGETIMIEVDEAVFKDAAASIGSDITIAGNITQDKFGHLAINATNKSTGYAQNVVIGASGTTLSTWHSSAQNSVYYQNTMTTMINTYTSMGILNASASVKWQALRGTPGIQPNF